MPLESLEELAKELAKREVSARELIKRCEYYNSLGSQSVGRSDAQKDLDNLLMSLAQEKLVSCSRLQPADFVIRDGVIYEPKLFGPGHIEIKFMNKDFALKCMRVYKENEPSARIYLFQFIE